MKYIVVKICPVRM